MLDGPGVEPAKLVVLLAGTGAHGNAVEADLIAAGMPVEMADRDTIVPIVTLADDEHTVARFTSVLLAAVRRHRGPARRPLPAAAWLVTPELAIPPRQAFFLPHITLAASAAVGRVSAELVAPYPPGVPVLAPGEVITTLRWTRCARRWPTAAGSPTRPTPAWPRSRSSRASDLGAENLPRRGHCRASYPGP